MIADHSIRLAIPGDAAQIAAMSRDYIEYGLPWSWTPARVAEAIRDPDINAVVAHGPDTLLGFGIMGYTRDDAHLLLLAVRHDRRRSGIGSALLLWLEQAARTAGAARIRVESRWQNPEARNFYGEHGYHELAIRKGMYSGRVDGVLMEKWLRQAAGPEPSGHDGPPAPSEPAR